MNEISLNQYQKTILSEIVEATAKDPFYSLQNNNKTVNFLLDAGLIECNKSITEGTKVAHRATQKGINIMNETTETPIPEPEGSVPNAPSYQISDNVPLPPVRRAGAGGSSQYPFDQLEVGQSFFVPATEEKPNPGKTLQSTVSSASRRYAEKTDEMKEVNIKGEIVERPKLRYHKKFTVRSVEEEHDGVMVKGARVWRIEPPANPV